MALRLLCLRSTRAAPLAPARGLCGRSPLSLPLRAPALRRCLCSEAPKAPEPEPEPAPEVPKLLFSSPKEKMVKTIKMVSIGNLMFGVAATPLLYYITSMVGSGGKGIAMSSLIVGFGAATTGALYWATKTYVYAVHSIPGRDAMRVTTPTLFGGKLETDVEWADVVRPSSYHPFATFEAKGQMFYLDELADIHDEAFPGKILAKLNPDGDDDE